MTLPGLALGWATGWGEATGRDTSVVRIICQDQSLAFIQTAVRGSSRLAGLARVWLVSLSFCYMRGD